MARALAIRKIAPRFSGSCTSGQATRVSRGADTFAISRSDSLGLRSAQPNSPR